MGVKLHLKFVRIRAEFYAESSRALLVIGRTEDGRRYKLEGDRVNQVRCAKWTRDYREFYSFNGVSYRVEEWKGAGLIMLVEPEAEIG